MAIKNYTYPRVDVSTTALRHRRLTPVVEDTLTLFVPIVANKGPANELTVLHSLEEFNSVFGLDTERLGLTALNISNWLTAGGTVYAYRLVKKENDADTPSKKASESETISFTPSGSEAALTGTITITAKYAGAADLYVKLTREAGSQFVTVKVMNSVSRVLEIFKIKLNEIAENEARRENYSVSNISEYIGSVSFDLPYALDLIEINTSKIQLKGGTDGYATYKTALEEFWTGDDPKAAAVLGNELESPIDVILDAGYPINIKKGMAAFVKIDPTDSDNDGTRTDITCILDAFEENGSISEDSIVSTLKDTANSYESSSVAVYRQHFKISEEAYFDEEKEVGASYFLSQLLPANDLANGIQFPVAGKRRAVLEGVVSLSKNPLPDEKEQYFKERTNYAEKDTRGIYLMSQRTFDGSTDDNYTALSFLNNRMTLVRIIHELKALGRDYLFEFNDSVTLANLSSVLNKYLTNWIANRALSYGNVVVSHDPYSEEAVDVQLNVKFTGSIEVISVDIIIE